MLADKIKNNIQKVISGKHDVIKRILTALMETDLFSPTKKRY